MRKRFYLPLFILLALSMISCLASNTNQLQATNQALTNQVNTLMNQLTQQAASPSKITQEPSTAVTESAPTSASTPISPSPLPPAGQTTVIAPSLIYSGSGTLIPWTNKSAYTSTLFGAANVHMLCDPNDAANGQLWIDNKSYIATCPPNSESWFPWKQDITAGNHYIYATNANDKYEFWTAGSTPFTIRNKYARSDYMFMINQPGIYNLSAKLIKGAFSLYLTCEKAQNFSYENIAQSTTVQVVFLYPARCELLVRDSPPGTLTPGEIEVSLEFVK
jgi:hypothetical protein